MTANLFKRVKVESEQQQTYVLFRSLMVHKYSKKKKPGQYHLAKKVDLVTSRTRSLCSLVTYFDMAMLIKREDLDKELQFVEDSRSRGKTTTGPDIRKYICKECLSQL